MGRQWTPQFLSRLARVPDHLNLDMEDRRFFQFGVFGAIFAGLCHFSFIILFLAIHVRILAVVNVVSVSVYFLALWLIRKRMFSFTMFLVCLELVIHAFLCVYFIGWASGIQYYFFLVTTIAFLLPKKRNLSFILSILSVASCVGTYLFVQNSSPVYSLPQLTLTLLSAFSISVMGLVLSFLGYTYQKVTKDVEKKLILEQEKSEMLLLNILPKPIAARLKEDQKVIADGFAGASVLFADIVEFTVISGRLTPEEVVMMLNNVFSRFDDLAQKHGLEKIKTIGDAYMVAAGVPEPDGRHAFRIADCALDMMKAIREFDEENGTDVSIRIGINSGPVVAGVIGKRKFIYDLWGDTVNTASRMESHGLPGEIQAGPCIHDLLKGSYDFACRGDIAVKGKGLMTVWLLKGRAQCLPTPAAARVANDPISPT